MLNFLMFILATQAIIGVLNLSLLCLIESRNGFLEGLKDNGKVTLSNDPEIGKLYILSNIPILSFFVFIFLIVNSILSFKDIFMNNPKITYYNSYRTLSFNMKIKNTEDITHKAINTYLDNIYHLLDRKVRRINKKHIENIYLIDRINEEERKIFLEKTIEEIYIFLEKEKNGYNDINKDFFNKISKLNSKLEEIIVNLKSDFEFEENLIFKPYLNIISEEQYNEIDALTEKVLNIKNNSSVPSFNYEIFLKINTDLSILKDEINNTKISKQQFINKINLIKENINYYYNCSQIFKKTKTF